MAEMKLFALPAAVLLAASVCSGSARAQTAASGPSDKPATSEIETLAKKIDEQSSKIDALSQQLLKLEQQISNIRPGVLIGEATPSAPAATADAGNAHVVTKGETLTSIAKAHKVGVQDLQKFNHIENDRALQIGQTIMIPAAGSVAPAPSPTTSPNE